MKFFIDTANIDQIKDANNMGMVDGVTTNPSLIAKESGEDTYACIDMAVHKIERQLRRKKEKQRNNKHIPGMEKSVELPEMDEQEEVA